MDPVLYLLLFASPLVLIVLSFWQNPTAEKGRQKDLARLAQKLGLAFRPDENTRFAQRFSFLNELHQGDDRYAFNVISGRFSAFPVIAFDFHYTMEVEQSGAIVPVHYFTSVLILETGGNLPELKLTGETWKSRFKNLMDHRDIHLESAEFSKAFQVRSPNKKFTYDFCNPRMMEYLLLNRDLHLEIERDALALIFDGQLSPRKIEFNFKRLVEIRLRMPDYLFTAGKS